MKYLLAIILSLAASFPAHAEDYPSRPVRIIVPYPPGGNTDIVARLMADQLGKLWGRPVRIAGDKMIYTSPLLS